jgi:hypothetical protein
MIRDNDLGILPVVVVVEGVDVVGEGVVTGKATPSNGTENTVLLQACNNTANTTFPKVKI